MLLLVVVVVAVAIIVRSFKDKNVGGGGGGDGRCGYHTKIPPRVYQTRGPKPGITKNNAGRTKKKRTTTAAQTKGGNASRGLLPCDEKKK